MHDRLCCPHSANHRVMVTMHYYSQLSSSVKVRSGGLKEQRSEAFETLGGKLGSLMSCRRVTPFRGCLWAAPISAAAHKLSEPMAS